MPNKRLFKVCAVRRSGLSGLEANIDYVGNRSCTFLKYPFITGIRLLN